MAISDLALRNKLLHTGDTRYVTLQLEVPQSHPVLRGLFGCQVTIDAIDAPGFDNEWKNSELGQELDKPARRGNERGTIGSLIILANSTLSFHDLQRRQHGIALLLGKDALFDRRNALDYPFSLNAKIRCLSVERDGNRIWLVRGEILSGGLIFDDSRVFATDPDLDRIWPGGGVRGIFFTGTELQLEVSPNFDATQRIRNGSLPSGQPAALNQVKITSSGTMPSDRGLLFRAREKNTLPWGEWHVVRSWAGNILTLRDPYPDDAKPDPTWRFEVWNTPRVKRYRLLGIRRDRETGAVVRAVWEHTSATRAMSAIPNDPGGPVHLEQPSEAAGEYLAKVQELSVSLRFGVAPGQGSATRPIVVVDNMNSSPSTRTEFVRVDWTVKFDRTTGFDADIQWQPRTLLVTSNKYQLLDRDEVDRILNSDDTAPTTAPVDEVAFRWTDETPTRAIKLTLPDTRLVGTKNEGRAAARELWFSVACAQAGPYAGAPLAWASVTAEAASAVPAGNGAQAARLGGPIQFKSADWIVTTAPADANSGRATDPPGLCLTLTPGTPKKATLELFAPDVTLDSPTIPFYFKPLNDPKSVPNERRPDEGTVTDSLRFIYRPEWARERPSDGLPSSPVASLAPDGTLAPDVSLFYKVTAIVQGSETIPDREVSATPTALNRKVVLNWRETPNASGYKVYRTGNAGIYPSSSLVATIASGSTTTLTDSGLTPTAGSPPIRSTTDRPESSVLCRHDPDPAVAGRGKEFIISRAPHALRLFLPAEYALVDPVSVTRGNLVGRQQVAFPLFDILPSASVSGVYPLEVRHISDASGARTEIDLEKRSTASTPMHVDFDDLEQDAFSPDDHFKGFYLQLQPSDSARKIVVARIRRHSIDAAKLTIVVNPRPEIDELVSSAGAPDSNAYSLTIGPTRLALPRDVNHGLLPVGVQKLWLDPPPTGMNQPTIQFVKEDVRGEEGQSVLALHPWSEWGPRQLDSAQMRPWLTTGRARLHHRNLIQEHAEFESSFEDRFPPEGPAPDPMTGALPSPLLPLSDFLRAVRDRYTAATGNGIIETLDPSVPPNTKKEAKQIRNWLPGCNFVQEDDTTTLDRPQVTVSLTGDLPEARIDTAPFKPDNIPQALKLRKVGDPGADRHWLDVSVRLKGLTVGSAPTLRLTETDASDATSRRAMDSSAPLLFSRHDVCSLATIDAGDGQTVAIVGGPEGDATGYLFRADGTIADVESRVLNGSTTPKPLLDVALVRHGSDIRGLAIQKDGSTIRLVRFNVTVSPGSLTIGPGTLVTGTPTALACAAEDGAFTVAVLTTAPAEIRLVNANTGADLPDPAADAIDATAIAWDRDPVTGFKALAVGYERSKVGKVKVWGLPSGGTWTAIGEGTRREVNSAILGPQPAGADELDKLLQELKIVPGKKIRGLRVIARPGQTMVVAVDGTRFPCTWGIKTPFSSSTPPAVWLQSADALTVAAVRVEDLERRFPAPSAPLPMFAVGLRSGEVRVAAATVLDDDLIDVRSFDTVFAPVIRLSLPIFRETLADGATEEQALCFAGTAAGGLLAWDLRRGVEWPDSDSTHGLTPIAQTAYLDALGVVREVPAEGTLGLCTVDRLSLGSTKYLSISTPGLKLAVDSPASSVLEFDGLTDVRIWADALKVLDAEGDSDTDGKVEPRQFPDGEFDPGHVGFFSEVAHDKQDQDETRLLFAAFDYVPRLAGVPFVVTRVERLELTTDRRSVAGATVLGVLINPDEIASGQDPADIGTPFGVVARALSRGNPVRVTFAAGDWSIEPDSADRPKSEVDWTFAVNRQTPLPALVNDPPGGLARVCSEPGTFRRQAVTRRLCFDVDFDPAQSQSSAVAFGRLWSFKAPGRPVTLVGHATFRRKSDLEPWQQQSYAFRTEAATELLTCEHRWEFKAADTTLVYADARTLAWSGGRYAVFHDPATGTNHTVYVVDRTTGLAATATRHLFSNTNADAPVMPTEATLESATKLTVAAGRATTNSGGRVEFVHLTGDSLANGTDLLSAKRAEWASADFTGCPSVRMSHVVPTKGEISGWMEENGLARFAAETGSPLPPMGALLTFVGEDTGVRFAGRVFGVDGRKFVLAKDIEGDEATGVEFLQFAQRIETATAVMGEHQLTLSDAGATFNIGDHVRIVAPDGTGEAGTISVVAGPVVAGLTTAPAAGARLHRVVPITSVEPPNQARPTVRLHTDPVALVDRFLLVHPADVDGGAGHLAINSAADGFDLYEPGDLRSVAVGARTFQWRAVQPFVATAIGGGDAEIDVGTATLPAFTPIRLSDVTGDATLVGDWATLPSTDTYVLLCRIKNGDGVTITDPGTWSAHGSAAVAPQSMTSTLDQPIVVTTTIAHGLADGDTVDIAGVDGAAVPDGSYRARVKSTTEFLLYVVGTAPATATRGVWERLDDDKPVTALDLDRFPTALTATEPPPTRSRFRFVADGIAGEIFVAEELPPNSWEVLKPVTTLAATSCWSPLAPSELRDGTSSFVRVRQTEIPAATCAVLAYDRRCSPRLATEALRVVQTDRRGGYLAEEFVPRDATVAVKWTAAEKAVGVVAVLDNATSGKRLHFDEIAPWGEGAPRGSTQPQTIAIKHLVVGRCGGDLVAVTADGNDIRVWPVGQPESEVISTLTLTGTAAVRAIAAYEFRKDIINDPLQLFVVVLRGDELTVYRLDAADHASESSVTLSETPTRAFLGITEHAGEIVVAVGGTDSSGNFLATWRAPVTTSSLGPLEEHWGRTDVQFPVVSLAAGQAHGSAYFLVGLEDPHSVFRVEVWSPEGAIVIRSDKELSRSPQASLSIDFSNRESGAPQPVHADASEVTGRLRPSRRVQFTLDWPATALEPARRDRAFGQLEQGGYRCFTTEPTTPDATRGRAALLLWTSGDLTEDGDAAVGSRQLVASLARLVSKVERARRVQLKLVRASGPVAADLDAVVTQSLLSVHVGKPRVALFGTALIEADMRPDEFGRVRKLTLLLEGNAEANEMTGFLVLDTPPNGALQAIVRCDANLTTSDTLTLVDDVYWAVRVAPRQDVSDAEILLRSEGANRAAFSVRSFDVTDAPESAPSIGFVRLHLDTVTPALFQTIRIDENEVPLLPELEPSRLQSPERLGPDTVRLCHRVRSGLAMRPAIPSGRFKPVAVKMPNPLETDVPPHNELQLLEPVIDDGGPLVRLRAEGWLVRRSDDTEFRTDGLFVLNVDFLRDKVPVLTAIEARTRAVEFGEPTSASERLRYRELLRAAGAQGVAVTFRLTDGRALDLGFVDSPFFDHPGSAAPDPLVPDVAAARMGRGSIRIRTTLLGQNPWVYATDPRLLQPHELDRVEASGSNFRYVVADLAADPYADVCCLAHRQYRLERRQSTTDAETFQEGDTPILHSAEAPAFRQPARLSSPLTGKWQRTPFDEDDVNLWTVSRPFFPPRVDWELAADKPGALFQSSIQVRVTNEKNESWREPLIDFALREPQFVKIGDGCVTAEVKWQEGDTHVSQPTAGFAKAELVWTEVIGSVPIDAVDDDPWLEVRADGIGLTRPPLQLILDFNSEVVLVTPADAAVPAYRVEAQRDEADLPGNLPQVIAQPTKTYLVANPDLATVFSPQKVERLVRGRPDRECKVDVVSSVYKATLDLADGPFPASGTTLTLRGLTDPDALALNDVTFRFVGAGPLFDLTWDTATEDDFSTITINGAAANISIVSHRPLCVKITDSVANPDILNNATATVGVEVRRVRDGEPVTNLRLAQVAPKEKLYLIVTPAADFSSDPAVQVAGRCSAVATQAAGYLEAAVRTKAEVTRDHLKAWTPGLTLTEPADLTDLRNRLVGPAKLIRLGDAKAPQANGVFGLFGNALARASVGNGVAAAVSGSGAYATTFLDPFRIDLAAVDGELSPIVITLEDEPDPGHPWDDGTTPIAVRGVTAVPQANGTWVVKKVGEKKYALYEPTSVEQGDKIPAVVSAVIPLDDAFEPVSTRLAGLKPDFDPHWEPLDRPLLQVHWAGAGQFPSDDGKGIAWRPGGVSAGLYEQAKQVKFLANSQLSPKLAFVLTVKAPPSTAASLQRTILFGDSPPPFRAKPTLVISGTGSDTKTFFRLEVPDNRESLSVAVPQQASYDFVLHLVKSLPSGVVVFDTIDRRGVTPLTPVRLLPLSNERYIGSVRTRSMEPDEAADPIASEEPAGHHSQRERRRRWLFG